MSLQGLGAFGVILLVFVWIVGIIFGIVTATTIADFLQVVGWKWWVVAITLFAAIGSPLVSISRRE